MQDQFQARAATVIGGRAWWDVVDERSLAPLTMRSVLATSDAGRALAMARLLNLAASVSHSPKSLRALERITAEARERHEAGEREAYA